MTNPSTNTPAVSGRAAPKSGGASFAASFVVLAFLTAYTWSMGQTPPSLLNGFGQVVSLLFFVVAPTLYLLPTLEAWRAKHPNLASIALINVLLGWSLVGWVVAAVWALKQPEQAAPNDPAAIAVAPILASPQKQQKPCPFCAEDVLVAAIKCKHCGSDLRV